MLVFLLPLVEHLELVSAFAVVFPAGTFVLSVAVAFVLFVAVVVAFVLSVAASAVLVAAAFHPLASPSKFSGDQPLSLLSG